MPVLRAEERKAEIIDGVAARFGARLDGEEAALAERFVRAYYRDVAPEDLAERDPLDLYGAALAHLRLGQVRPPGQPVVRVSNPRLEGSGWQSTHTIVEIVNDDMPFLVDSVSNELARHGLTLHLIIHPVLGVRRDAAGRLVDLQPLSGVTGNGLGRESFMHIEVDRRTDPAVLAGLEADVARVLGDVRRAVEDWRPMRERVEEVIANLPDRARNLPEAEREEALAFLRWLADDHFTFLGYSCYALEEGDAGVQLRRAKGTGLGILRRRDGGGLSASFGALPPEVRARAKEPTPLLTITKAATRSTVHRSTYLDFVGVKRFAPDGQGVTGEHRFLGLLTSAAYSMSLRQIPFLSSKVERIVARSGFSRTGHAGKALLHILETYPRDELLQAPEDELFRIATGILQLQDRQRPRLFARADAFGRFVSCLVFVPRDRFNTGLRERVQQMLEAAVGATESEFQVLLSDSSLARVHLTLRTPQGVPADLDAEELERRLVEISRGWTDRLREALLEQCGEEAGNRLFEAFGRAFPASYQERVDARAAVPDILHFDRLASAPEGALALTLYRRLEDPAETLRFKLIRRDRPVLLSDALPILENMGLKVLSEDPSTIAARDGQPFWVHDFGLSPVVGDAIEVERVREHFQDLFLGVWSDRLENDGFNRLVLAAGMSPRAIVTLRAYCKHVLQIGTPFSQAYIEATLVANPMIAHDLAELFDARFNPAREAGRAERAVEVERRIEERLNGVASLDQDRILRRYLELIGATTRTNAWQPDPASGGPKDYLSFKFDPAAIPALPLPRPAFEIFVYAPQVEGVHLRGGRVARGGLRWSDRREDFRTEVLGLMKAQMVKNAVIVPVGAKGGFYVKRPPAGGDRAALQEEAVRCYRTFLKGLLDVTDNRTPDGAVPPRDVVRYDGDDPYLVVAADKGTATFSDVANAVSREYGFWLDDAFASGGSAGYDHKGMGITARGAWESVKRHFRELGLDTQAEPFTVVGIGDMSGDVFGNGMLLSDRIRLVAAFDHRHIFLDPDPDPARSFAERKRLFGLPRSSWDDYDRSLISRGGGVWPRNAKSIPLPDEARAVLGLEGAPAAPTPAELMTAILKAPVDLFWNGGIGTYVKAAPESHADAQDRVNDAIRVNGQDLRCRVVGEGGNLGCTQKGRIEFALKGGKINTDFIDNSAGVDCSDHEVNIKILLGEVVRAGDLTMKQRDELLASMTDEVAELVLRDNVMQNLALSITEHLGLDLLDAEVRLMRRLEAQGRLDRALEHLPGDDQLAERRKAGRGLTRPESAVLLAYAKMTLYADLLGTEIPDRNYLAGEIAKYFPRPLRRGYAAEIGRHRLRREIVATWIANSVVNRGLAVFVSELEDETGGDLEEVLLAYVIARDAFNLLQVWQAIEALPVAVPGDRQIALLVAVRDVMVRGTRWFMRHGGRNPRLGDTVARFRPGITTILDGLDGVAGEAHRARLAERATEHVAAGVDPGLARTVVGLPDLLAACDIVRVAATVPSSGGDGEAHLLGAARVHFALDEALGLPWLRSAAAKAPRPDRWHRLALTGIEDDLSAALRALTAAILAADGGGAVSAGGAEAAAAAVARWLEAEGKELERYRALLRELQQATEPGLPMLAVAVRTLGELVPRDAEG